MADQATFEPFTPEAVRAAWDKALARRHADPEGAIAGARTLLETVCKHILDAMNVRYSGTLGLPVLVKITTEQLSLAPSQRAEEPIRRVLGGTAQVVEDLGSPQSSRHAEFVISVAGAAATFLVETWKAQMEELFEDLEDSKGG
jgi:hypothetical protein